MLPAKCKWLYFSWATLYSVITNLTAITRSKLRYCQVSYDAEQRVLSLTFQLSLRLVALEMVSACNEHAAVT